MPSCHALNLHMDQQQMPQDSLTKNNPTSLGQTNSPRNPETWLSKDKVTPTDTSIMSTQPLRLAFYP